MSNDEFENFYRELNHTIERHQKVTYPLIGVINKVSANGDYADVKTESGVISNIPAHGFPVIGDTAIIHFINGNVEQPVCDCARRLSPTQEEVITNLSSQCLNYLSNGDFNQRGEGFSGTFTILEEKGYVQTGDYCCSLEDGEYIEFTCDISQCKTKYFKFQAQHRGQGAIRIECFDAETGETVTPQPERLSKEYNLWISENGRFGWVFNKETYLKESLTKVRFKITNVSTQVFEKIPTMRMGEEFVQIPLAVSLDGLLVYDENGDPTYYWNEDDLTTNYGKFF